MLFSPPLPRMQTRITVKLEAGPTHQMLWPVTFSSPDEKSDHLIRYSYEAAAPRATNNGGVEERRSTRSQPRGTESRSA